MQNTCRGDLRGDFVHVIAQGLDRVPVAVGWGVRTDCLGQPARLDRWRHANSAAACPVARSPLACATGMRADPPMAAGAARGDSPNGAHVAGAVVEERDSSWPPRGGRGGGGGGGAHGSEQRGREEERGPVGCVNGCCCEPEREAGLTGPAFFHFFRCSEPTQAKRPAARYNG